MAIITHLTTEDIEWYKQQVAWCRDLLATEVARCNPEDPRVYEPRKPTDFLWCKPEARAQQYIRMISEKLTKLRQDYPEMNVEARVLESDPPSVWRYERPSNLAFDCSRPWLMWSRFMDEQRVALGLKPIVPPRPREAA